MIDYRSLARRAIGLAMCLAGLPCCAAHQPAPAALAPGAPASGPVSTGRSAPSPGQPIEHLLQTLRSPVHVRAYVTRGSLRLDAFVTHLDGILASFAHASRGRFVYEIVDSTDGAVRAEARAAGLKDSTFEAESQGDAPIAGYMGVSFQYGSEKDVIPVLSPDSTMGIAYWIAMRLFEVRNKADGIHYAVGVLTGKDEVALGEPSLIAGDGTKGPSILSIMNQALPYYDIVPVDLAGGSQGVPPDLAGLIVTQPGRDYADAELQRIDEFVMQGRSLAVIAGAVNMQRADPSMTATLDLHGLERLLDGYGIHVHRDLVIDPPNIPTIPVISADGHLHELTVPGIAQPGEPESDPDQLLAIDQSATPFFRLSSFAVPYPSSLTIHPEQQPHARLRIVARTTASAWCTTTTPVSLTPDTPVVTSTNGSERALAALAEGTLLPAFPRHDGRGPTSARAGVFVLASGLFLVNPLARAGAPPMSIASGSSPLADPWLQSLSQPYAQRFLTASILIFKNTLDWLVLGSMGIAPDAGRPGLQTSSVM